MKGVFAISVGGRDLRKTTDAGIIMPKEIMNVIRQNPKILR